MSDLYSLKAEISTANFTKASEVPETSAIWSPSIGDQFRKFAKIEGYIKPSKNTTSFSKGASVKVIQAFCNYDVVRGVAMSDASSCGYSSPFICDSSFISIRGVATLIGIIGDIRSMCEDSSACSLREETIEVSIDEIEESIKKDLFFELAKKAGMTAENTEELRNSILKAIEKETSKAGLQLTEDAKQAFLDTILLVMTKTNEYLEEKRNL